MRVENELKLDYRDVLLRPKRSVLGSRKEVDLTREFTFRNGQTWTGIPIVASNMDHVGTVEMAKALSEHDMLTCVHKHYSILEWNNALNTPMEGEESFHKSCNNVVVSSGIKDEDVRKLGLILNNFPIKFICLDVANGYSERFSEFVKEVRKTWPDKIIIAGNVVTGDMTKELILNGADIVKVGIGPGCFLPDMEVLTEEGLKAISLVKEGDKVYTHTGDLKEVKGTMVLDKRDEVHYDIDGIKCTSNHEFYVVHKSDVDNVTDANIHDYAKWVTAENLTEDYFKVELDD